MTIPAASHASERDSARVPLVIDLDGTLIRSDTLWEQVMVMLKRTPWDLIRLLSWLSNGKASFKHALARHSMIDPTHLPYTDSVLALIDREGPRRPIILCTGANERVAQLVAEHLGVFSGIMASSPSVNLTGRIKHDALVERFGTKGFDYVGNDLPDLEVFRSARHAMVVNPTRRLSRRLRGSPDITSLASPPQGAPRDYLRALRPVQWAKNTLVFVPMLATLESSTSGTVLKSGIVFVAFGLLASSVYVLNDLVDLGADRQHPRKRLRPWASASLPLQHALLLVPVLMISGLAAGLALSPLVAAILALYWACTSLYSFWLKRVPLLDTLVLAGLYTFRILAGAAAILVVPSVWLLSFSMFLFLSLALAKRHSELLERADAGTFASLPGRGYRPEDLSVIVSQGAASGYAAVLVLTLYIDNGGVRGHYRHPEVIWLICPLVLYWINKLWLNSQRREIREDPVTWALTNRVSRAIAVVCVGLLVLAKFLP